MTLYPTLLRNLSPFGAYNLKYNPRHWLLVFARAVPFAPLSPRPHSISQRLFFSHGLCFWSLVQGELLFSCTLALEPHLLPLTSWPRTGRWSCASVWLCSLGSSQLLVTMDASEKVSEALQTCDAPPFLSAPPYPLCSHCIGIRNGCELCLSLSLDVLILSKSFLFQASASYIKKNN